jgi:hypothetical protein
MFKRVFLITIASKENFKEFQVILESCGWLLPHFFFLWSKVLSLGGSLGLVRSDPDLWIEKDKDLKVRVFAAKWCMPIG